MDSGTDSAAMGTTGLLAHVVPYTLVMFRIAGLFVFAPLLTNIMVPRRFKTLIVLMLAATLYPLVQPTLTMAPARLDVIGLLPLVVMEALIGLAMGVLAAVPLLSLEMSGVLMGQSMGLGLARVYNPEADVDVDVLGQFLYYLGAGVFIACGGLELLFKGLIDSFERVPLGGFTIAKTPLDLLTGVLSSGFELAIRVSAPVTGIVLLLVVLFGVVGKTMPQLNIMSVGFAIKIIAGLAMLAAAVYAVRTAVGDEVVATLKGVTDWVHGLK